MSLREQPLRIYGKAQNWKEPRSKKKCRRSGCRTPQSSRDQNFKGGGVSSEMEHAREKSRRKEGKKNPQHSGQDIDIIYWKIKYVAGEETSHKYDGIQNGRFSSVVQSHCCSWDPSPVSSRLIAACKSSSKRSDTLF